MGSLRAHRRRVSASKLLTVLLIAALGTVFGLAVAGFRTSTGLVSFAASASLTADPHDRAHNPEAPGQPPSRLLDTNLQKDGSDDGLGLANLGSTPIELCAAGGRWLTFIERSSHPTQQPSAGHGARGPPAV